jgi:diaminopimelate decarboxylase
MLMNQADPGERELGGVPVGELAQTYKTPLLVIDTNVLDANVLRFTAPAADIGTIDVAYAGKALLFTALARRFAQTPLKLDVCSLGELTTAERAHFPAERIVLHGCAKVQEVLAAAVAGRVGRIVVDHHDELQALTAQANPARPVSLLLRVNMGISAHTHEYIRTGGEDSKFGFPLPEVEKAIRTAIATPALRLVGIHSHIGSQILEYSSFLANLSATIDIYARARSLGAPMSEINIGGGFGIDEHTGEMGLDIPMLLSTLAALLKRECAQRAIPEPRLGIEPGRSIIASAGTSLYRLATVKQQGERRFAVVDGSLADNPRPALYGALHPAALASRHSKAPLVETTICGRSCENDRLAVTKMPEDLRQGDLITFGITGAYTFSMASNYNRFPRPAVVFAGNGKHRAVVSRETLDDILARDLDT